MVTPTTAPHRSALSLTRGAVVGVGVLVAGAASVPPALAVEEPPAPPGPGAGTALVPAAPAPRPLVVLGAEDGPDGGPEAEAALTAHFGRGKQAAVQVVVAPGTAPGDLDLSGAAVRFTGLDDPAASGTCTTDAWGWCAVPLPVGRYAATQLSAPAGLVAADGPLGVFEVCSPSGPARGPGTSCGFTSAELVQDSALRQGAVVSVVDALTGAPVAGAAYDLTGPAPSLLPDLDDELVLDGLPRAFALAAADAGTGADAALPPADGVRTVSATSDDEGRLAFEGWFLPGAHTLAPSGTAPDGYETDPGQRFDLAAEPADGAPWTFRHALRPVPAPPVPTGGDQRPGTPEPVPPQQPVTQQPVTQQPVTQQPVTRQPALQPAPLPPAAAPQAQRPSTGARGGAPASPEAAGPAAGAADAVLPAAGTESPVAASGTAAPTRAATPPAAPREASSAAAPSAGPEVRTASSGLPVAGVAGFAVALAAVALVGVGALRRRARRGA